MCHLKVEHEINGLRRVYRSKAVAKKLVGLRCARDVFNRPYRLLWLVEFRLEVGESHLGISQSGRLYQSIGEGSIDDRSSVSSTIYLY